MVNRDGGQSGRWSIGGTVVNRDRGQYYRGQSERWSIGTVVNRDGGQSKRGQYQRGQSQRGQSGLWSILTWPNGCHPRKISRCILYSTATSTLTRNVNHAKRIKV